MTSPDVVVIGGGIIGVCCAYYLALEGLKVHLVEKGALASGTSGACEGNILIWDKPLGIMLEMQKSSVALYDALVPQLPMDIEYVKKGSILVVEGEEDLPRAEQMVRAMQAEGVNTEFLDLRELRHLEPRLADDLAGGAIFPDDSQVQPMLAVLAIAEAARRLGAVIQPGAEVKGITLSEGAVAAVETGTRRIPTRAVIDAAGVWSKDIGAMAGVEVPIEPRKGQIVVTEPTANVVQRKMMEAAYTNVVEADDRGLAIAAVVEHTRSGNVLLGSSREFVGFDRSVDPQVVQAIVARAIRFFPCLKGIHAIRSYAGLRPFPADHKPIIGEADAVKGFYLATGHEGGGIGLAPITGRLITQMITGQEPALPVDELLPARFAGCS